MENRNRIDGVVIQALVIANATVDETYSVDRLPASGESLVGRLSAHDVGGKGANVATILARCGLATRLTAVIGKDVRGDFIKNELMQEAIDLDLVQSTRCSTDVSLINVDANGDNTIVTTADAAHSLESSYACNVLDRVPENSLLILQGNLTEELTQLLVLKANKAGVKVALNPSPYWPWLKSVVPAVDVVFMNATEALAMTGKSDEAAITAVLDTGPIQVVLTRGDNSALLGTRHEGAQMGYTTHIESMPSIATTAVDTTGAGDTYMAVAIASAVKRGVALDLTALSHAAYAAARTISIHGARSAFPTSAELASILTSRPDIL